MTYKNFKYPVIDMRLTGRSIKRFMDLNGMTVNDIKDALGLKAPQSIYHWLDGRSLPTIDNMYALSKLFSVPIDSIIIGDRGHPVPLRVQFFYERIELYYKLIYAKRAG